MNSLTKAGKNSLLFSASTSEDEIGAIIDRIRLRQYSKKLLMELLYERHPIYYERPGYQMTRIKGYTMASFLEVGLPNSTINFVLDELQNGRDAYMVGAAARGLRGAKHPKAQYGSFLIQAIDNLRYHDDSFDLTVFKPEWPLKRPSSGRLEIFRTLQWLKGYARATLPELKSFINNTKDFSPELREEIRKTIDVIEEDQRELDLSCCEVEGKSILGISWLWKGMSNIKSIGNLEVQNEDGKTQSLEDVIDQKPTVVAFFYTRCMNPNKCTLTINKLGWLQQELLKSGLQEKVNLLAFTYDPSYDTPSRMHVFGKNRGMHFGLNVHMLRTRLEDFSLLSDFFELGVNHVASTVNQHRLELFLLDKYGNIKTSYTRLQWEVEKVFEDIKSMLVSSSRSSWLSSVASTFQQTCFPVLLAFFPKCPICWAVYLSAFGVSGLQSIPYSPWLIPWIILAIVINLIILYRKARVRNGLSPFYISLTGGLLVIGPGYLLADQTSSIVGIIFILIGALLNSLPYRQWSKWTHTNIN
ncbi:MAG: SCO family protein [Bacteroidota bacterium]